MRSSSAAALTALLVQQNVRHLSPGRAEGDDSAPVSALCALDELTLVQTAERLVGDTVDRELPDDGVVVERVRCATRECAKDASGPSIGTERVESVVDSLLVLSVPNMCALAVVAVAEVCEDVGGEVDRVLVEDAPGCRIARDESEVDAHR